MSEVVYMDMCCFKRAFDDATQERIRREAEAVASILSAATTGVVRLIRSAAHDFENDRNPREDRRLAAQLWISSACTRVRVPVPFDRARELEVLGFAPLDAMHLAYAEKANARWFVTTTDDRLLSLATTHAADVRTHVVTPDHLVAEIGVE